MSDRPTIRRWHATDSVAATESAQLSVHRGTADAKIARRGRFVAPVFPQCLLNQFAFGLFHWRDRQRAGGILLNRFAQLLRQVLRLRPSRSFGHHRGHPDDIPPPAKISPPP